jgi:dipeptidyl aminopeptidase/acylaminoacyl peptidase
MEQTYGSIETNPDFWRSISANSYVSELNGPIQLHTGTADHDVPWEYSQILYDELLQANRVAELYLYDGDNHNISVNFSVAMQRTIEFFDKYVKNR